MSAVEAALAVRLREIADDIAQDPIWTEQANELRSLGSRAQAAADSSELVGVPLEDLLRVLALADVTEDVSLDEAKARVKVRQLARLAELQTERLFENLGRIEPGSLLIFQAAPLLAAADAAATAGDEERAEVENLVAGLVDELRIVTGHDEFAVLIVDGENAVELQPWRRPLPPAERPDPVMPEGPAPWNPPAEPYVPSMDLGGRS